MQKIIVAAEELSQKMGFSLEESVKIILMYQNNKLLEKIMNKMELEPFEINRFIN